jgi:putative two-component system response regulator
MKTHAKLGSDAIEQAERDAEKPVAFLSLAKEIAHWHHEKWDGSGYPDGLSRRGHPRRRAPDGDGRCFRRADLGARVQAAMSYAEARDIIAAGRGKHFDPDVVDVFIAGFDEFVAVAERYWEEA